MANWEYGTFKIRGKHENILKFIQHFHFDAFYIIDRNMFGEDITDGFRFSSVFIASSMDDVLESITSGTVAKDDTIITYPIYITSRYSSENDFSNDIAVITKKCNVDVKGYVYVYSHSYTERFISAANGKNKFTIDDMQQVICMNCKCDEIFCITENDSDRCSLIGCGRTLTRLDTFMKPMGRKRKKKYNNYFSVITYGYDARVKSKSTKNGRKSFITTKNTYKRKSWIDPWKYSHLKQYLKNSLRPENFKACRKILNNKEN